MTRVRVELYAPLPKAPSAFSLTVRKLIGRVHEGAVRVPTFQRPLRWQAGDVVKLFDSLLKGYPIGSLLFWKRTLPADAALKIGAATIAAPETADGWFIVDGQQRVTALAATLLDLDQHGDTRWQIRFDPSKSAFLSGPASPDEARRQVPLRVLGDLRRLGRWLPTCGLDEDAQRRVEEVQQRILDYEVPCTLVDTDDEDALKGVFARLNSTGARMRADEVFQALLGQGAAASRGRRRPIDLAELQRAADVDGFGEPPRGEALKALLAMSGLDPVKRLEDLGDGALGRVVGEEDAAEAIRRASAFLRAPLDAAEPGAGIPTIALVPYPVVFVILARWFHLFPEPDPATRQALSQWVWRGVATGVHQRAAVSAMRHQVRHLREDDLGGSLSRLLHAVAAPPAREWSLDPFHAGHAASRVEVLTLLARSPRDRVGPVSWRALLSSGERVAREVFRVDRFPGGATRELARTAANRVLLDARHSNLATVLRTWTQESDQGALESHLIDAGCLDALCDDDAPRFLELRASRLRSAVASFLAQRTRVDGPLVLPVEAYVEPQLSWPTDTPS